MNPGGGQPLGLGHVTGKESCSGGLGRNKSYSWAEEPPQNPCQPPGELEQKDAITPRQAPLSLWVLLGKTRLDSEQAPEVLAEI